MLREDCPQLLSDHAPDPVVINTSDSTPLVSISIFNHFDVLKPLKNVIGIYHRNLFLNPHIRRILNGCDLDRDRRNHRRTSTLVLACLQSEGIAVGPSRIRVGKSQRNLCPCCLRRVIKSIYVGCHENGPPTAICSSSS